MARKRMRTPYDNLTASDLARITRERGLQKPEVTHLGEWADWLYEQDKQALAAANATPAAVPAPAADDYDSMKVSDLRALARQRGVDVTDLKTKPEIIDALQAADGMTEDQQAALDDEASAPEE